MPFYHCVWWRFAMIKYKKRVCGSFIRDSYTVICHHISVVSVRYVASNPGPTCCLLNIKQAISLRNAKGNVEAHKVHTMKTFNMPAAAKTVDCLDVFSLMVPSTRDTIETQYTVINTMDLLNSTG